MISTIQRLLGQDRFTILFNRYDEYSTVEVSIKNNDPVETSKSGYSYEDLDGESLLNVAIEEALKQRCGNCAFYGHDSRCFQSDVVVKHRCTPWVEKDYRCKFWKEDTEVFYKGCRIKIMYNTYNSLWYATITNETAWKIELNAKIKEDALENAKTFIDNLGVIDE